MSILLGASLHVYGQDAMRDLFYEAEFDFMDELYEDALKKYLRVLKSDPSNCNYNYKAGQCYLHIPGKKEEAVPYFEAAVLHTSTDYKDGVYKETNAPVDAFYYLGIIYRIGNRLDEAIDVFTRFKELNEDEFVEDEIIDKEIASCTNAKRLQQEIIDYKMENLGEKINNKYTNYRPAVSDDMSTLAYTTIDDEGYKEIYVSKKGKEGAWDKPKRITDEVGSRGDCYASDLSRDGTQLLIVQNDGFVADIYYSIVEYNQWSGMKKLSGNLNSKYFETFASFSPDEKTIYFTSDRKGTLGGLDIYRMDLNDKGKWEKPVNIGSPVNTIFNEETPVMADESTLYFSSEGHDNMGGFDIFYTEKGTDGVWGNPVNVGYPVNTTDDDLGFMPIEQGNYAYYFQATPDGYGALDIYKYEIFSDRHPRMIVLKGSVNVYGGEIEALTNYSITLKEKKSGDVLASIYPDTKGNFSHIIYPGSYQLLFDVVGYEQKTETVEIPKGYPDADYALVTSLAKIEVPVEPEDTTIMLAENIAENKNVTEPVQDNLEPAESLTGHAGFTIQICATRNAPDMSKFSDVDGVKVVNGDDGFYRYIVGEFDHFKAATDMLGTVKEKGYSDAFINNLKRYYESSSYSITKGKNGYTIQIMALKRPVDGNYFKNVNGVRISRGEDGFYRYTVGEYVVTAEAKKYIVEVKQKGYADAFIRKLSGISNY